MSSPQPPGTGSRVPATMILVAMLFPVFMAFAYPASYVSAMHQPAPHHMEVEVVGTSDSTQQLARQVAAQGGDALDVSTVADAATLRLPRRIPWHIAMEMLFTGRWMEAREAARWGLVNRVVPGESLLAEARRLADELAAGPPLVFAAIKEIAREAETLPFIDAMLRIRHGQFAAAERLYRSEDEKEGARAFAEKRDPVWRGR